MNHLFVVRHGDYDDNCRLSKVGKEQIEALAAAIKGIISSGSAYILSSTAPRALDSAEVLRIQLGLTEIEKVPYLRTGGDSEEYPNYENNYDRKPHEVLTAIVNERRIRADALVIMTHSEVTDSFPSKFYKAEFGQDVKIAGVKKGKAVHFDLEHKTFQVIPTI